MTFHVDEVEAASVKQLVQVLFCNSALFSFAAAHLPSRRYSSIHHTPYTIHHTLYTKCLTHLPPRSNLATHESLDGFVTRFVYDDGVLHSLEDQDFKESMMRVIKPQTTIGKRILRRHRGRCKGILK
jgi:hypothetical protein